MIITDDYIISNFFSNKGKLNGNFSSISYLKEKNPEVLEYLLKRFDDAEGLHEIFMRIFFKIEKRPSCPICGKPVSYRGKKSHLFNDTCACGKCYTELRSQRMIKKYGISNFGGTKESLEKIRKTKEERYGDPNYHNVEKMKKTNIERYGLPCAFNEEILQKRKETCKKHFGVEIPSQSDEVLNKIKNTCIKKYGVDNYRKSEECKKKIIDSKRKNGTFVTSKIEEKCYQWLIEKYGNDDVYRQYTDKRYSNVENGHLYHCDFYIKSSDLFIEVNGYVGHGPHPFDLNNKEDLELVEKWKQKSIEKPIYNCFIEGWTKHDVNKRNSAKSSHINYIEIFDRLITKEKLFKIIETYKNESI